MEKTKITKRVSDAAGPPASGERRIWDSEIAGFCLRGSELGHDLTGDGLRAAFALIIRARLVAELHPRSRTKR